MKEVEKVLFIADAKPKSSKASALQKVQNLAQKATQAYEANQLGRARYALEEILLLDGDQRDILRSLLTVTSEQEDIEAYERCWRRHVKVLLWRIVRGDGADCAWDDLIRFYTQVAEATERALDKPVNEIPALLPRPGLLPRWLEANSALVWLDAATKSRRTWQTGLDGQRLATGQQGYLALMRYWYRLFYPEFLPWLEIGTTSSELPAVPLPSSESAIRLIFNPTSRMVRHFLEWFRVGFALSNDDGATQERHRQTITALAGVITRLPVQFYTKDEELLKAFPAEADLDRKPFRSLLQEACSYPLYAFKLSKLLEAGDWQSIVAEFSEPDIEDKLNPTVRMFVALALCRTEREFDGLQLACRTVPDAPAEELHEDKQIRNLWDNILRANIGYALNTETLPPGCTITPTEAALESKRHSQVVQTGWIDAIKKQVGGLSSNGHLAVFRTAALAEIDSTYLQQTQVRAVMQKTQELVQKGEFDQARSGIKSLPDTPEEIKELKANLLNQLVEAEGHYRLQKRIESAIAKSRTLVEKGDFSRARQTIRGLPDTPADMKKLKSGLIGQVETVERQAAEHDRLQRQVDQAIQETQRHVQNGNFWEARRSLDSLPDDPLEIKDLKKRLLSQVDTAESQHQEQEKIRSNSSSYIGPLLQKLSRKGVNMQAVAQFANDNNIDISDPVQFYQLLKAVDQQVS